MNIKAFTLAILATTITIFGTVGISNAGVPCGGRLPCRCFCR
jgi:hypothetical protein